MLENFYCLNAHCPQFFTAVFFVFGAIVGSFLNVCIFRIPRGESIVYPGSHCACGKPIPFRHNIPILSWFLLRGRAACCGRRFGFRYPAVEFLSAALFAAAWEFLPWQDALAMMVFCAFGIVLALIDWDTMMLPDSVNAPFVLAGLVVSALLPEIHSGVVADENCPRILFCLRDGLIPAVVGMCVGGSLSYWFRYFASVIMRREALGEGDVILLGGIGAFFGWQGAIFAFFASAFIGLFAAQIFKIFGKKFTRRQREQEASMLSLEGGEDVEEFEKNASEPFPLGPWLIAGALIYRAAGEQICEFFFAGFRAI
ncbi:MAG: prepilin peptidase [Opitutae bacterium]|nr:prepilin peptidase [Opitutae bacterium]